jgi:hypothetical protein
MSPLEDSRLQLLIIVLGPPVLGQPALLQLFVLALLCVLIWIAAVIGAARRPEQIAGATR